MAENNDLARAGEVADGFGRALRALRVAAGLSQARLAARIGVPQTRVSEWESDPVRHSPAWRYVVRLAFALRVSTDAFTRPPPEQVDTLPPPGRKAKSKT